jgi:glycosyltransferase involved in cell wall biosynthesis
MKVSVIIPFYNAQAYLGEAIESILQQTFTDFELLLLNDGSTDNSFAMSQKYTDRRIRLLNYTQNQGLVAIRNIALQEAQGEYLAWLDADDIALPNRLAQQVAYLDKNPHIALLGSYAMYIDRQGNDIQLVSPKIDQNLLPIWLLFQNCFPQSAVMLRKKCLTDFTLQYRKDFPPAEDYDLWVQIAKHATISNLPQTLVKHRKHDDNITKQQREIQEANILKIIAHQLTELGINFQENELLLHRKISHYHYTPSTAIYEAIGKWLTKLHEANLKVQRYIQVDFDKVLAEIWYKTSSLHLTCGKEAKIIFASHQELNNLLDFVSYWRLKIAFWRKNLGYK